MDYQKSINLIMGMTDYERPSSTRGQRVRYNLDRITSFMSTLNDVHLETPCVHIAGTKGKGSTSSMISSILEEAGYLTGLFTSPHLHTFRERIQISNTPISESDFSCLVQSLWDKMLDINKTSQDRITVFELLTAMSFYHFKDKGTNINVIEVGLGGRLDSTNIVEPIAAGITSLGLDHTDILGNTISEIAWEKSGIIKDGIPVISASQPPEAMKVITDVCRDKGSAISKVGEDILWESKSSSIYGQECEIKTQNHNYSLKIPLIGDHQIENASIAIGVIERLTATGFQISSEAIHDGLLHVKWPCRFELINEDPKIVADGAHNPHSAEALVGTVKKLLPSNQIILVLGVSTNKDLEALINEYNKLSPKLILATRSRNTRAIEPTKISDAAKMFGYDTLITESVAEAVEEAKNFADKDDIILVTGSLFVAAEAREFVKNISPEIY